MSDVTLTYPGGELAARARFPRPSGNAGLDVSTAAQGHRSRRRSTTASSTPRPATVGDHLHRRRRGHPALPRLPDRAARARSRRSSRWRTCSSTASCPTADRARRLRRAASSGTRCCTKTCAASSTASRATRTRCRCCRSAVSALSTFYQDSLDPFDPEQVEISTIRLLAKLPTIAAYAYKKSRRPAVPLPRQLAEPRRQLPAHDLRRAGRALRGQPGHGEGARPAADPARRPRAELLDLDRAPRRLVAREPVRVDLGRHQRAVRPAARRRQPGRARDARRTSTLRRRREHLRPPGEEQRGRRQAHGLRAPRLQELRPAREDRQGGRGRGARRARRQRPAARHRA